MLKEDKIYFTRRITDIYRGSGAAITIDFVRVSKEKRDQIEKAADNFLDLAAGILEKEDD